MIVLLDGKIAFGCFWQKFFEFDVCSEIFLVKSIFFSINYIL